MSEPSKAAGRTGKFLRYVADYGLWDTLKRLGALVAARLFEPAFSNRTFPLYADFYAAGPVFHSAEDMLRAVADGAPTLEALTKEFDALWAELQQRYRAAALERPAGWGIRREPSFLLYGMVRRLRPMVALEMGVANGQSTYFILRAMKANGGGVLHSVDIFPTVGVLLAPEEKAAWKLHLLTGEGDKNDFRELLRTLPELGLLFHDGDQDPRWIGFMLKECAPRMAPDGVVAINDADWSYAMLHYCREAGFKPSFLMANGKVVGVSRLRREDDAGASA